MEPEIDPKPPSPPEAPKRASQRPPEVDFGPPGPHFGAFWEPLGSHFQAFWAFGAPQKRTAKRRSSHTELFALVLVCAPVSQKKKLDSILELMENSR